MSTNVSLTSRFIGGTVLTKVCGRFRGALVSIIPKTISNVQNNSTNATFDIQPYKLHNLDKGPAETATLTSDEAIHYYKELHICRRIETASASLYKEKVIRGFCHLYAGQEAIAVGVRAVMRPQDSVITAYRCHAWTYIVNGTALGVIAELTGRKSGCARGKGGSMHMYGKNFYGGNGIVGGQVPLGTGIGLAHKYKGSGGISFTLYGDGAANQGQLFEAFNIAKLWVLPVVFICENNKYGLGTAAARAAACTDYYTRGHYIPGIWVDGMDVLACREATRYAIEWVTGGKGGGRTSNTFATVVERIRQLGLDVALHKFEAMCFGSQPLELAKDEFPNNGPIVMEMETYRYYGHSMSDPGTSYRSREEVQQVRQTRDPITVFREKILKKKLVTPEKIKEIETSVRKHVDEVAKQSSTDPEVGVEELAADVYVDSVISEIRGVRPDKPLTHLSVAKRN